MTPGFHHITVLRKETVEALGLQPGQTAVDCTAGGGGHTRLLLQAVGPNGLVIALDRDIQAIANLQVVFKDELKNGCLKLVQSAFSNISAVCDHEGVHGKVAGICADLGVSSPQLDQGERGFSFAKDGPLDMRMDRSSGQPASEIVNEWDEGDLTAIFRDYGEEPKARFVARAIAKKRQTKPITTTLELADLVKETLHYGGPSRKHPATKVFQALRIVVNKELEELEALLEGGFAALAPRGRLGIISFHSLEDRLVKNFFKLRGKPKPVPRDLPLTASQIAAMQGVDGEIIKPFPITPAESELEENPRSRSAKLRVIQKN